MQTNTDPTLVHHTNGGTMLTGDAIPVFRVITIRSAIKMHRDCGMIPTRGMTITRLFGLAKDITGNTYKRGQHDAAIADLTTWIDAAKASLPIQDDRH